MTRECQHCNKPLPKDSHHLRKYCPPCSKEVQKENNRKRYAEDTEYRERLLENQRKNDRKRYAEDTEYRERRLENQRKRNAQKSKMIRERQEWILNNPTILEDIRKQIMKEDTKQ